MKKKQLLHFQRSITHTEIYNDSDIDIDIFMVLCLQLVGRGLIGKAGAQHILPYCQWTGWGEQFPTIDKIYFYSGIIQDWLWLTFVMEFWLMIEDVKSNEA